MTTFAGTLGLLGGGELSPGCVAFDRALVEATGAAEVVVVTAALARQGSAGAALAQAAAYFGRIDVGVVDAGLTRPTDARRAEVTSALSGARLVYLLGGDPGRLRDCIVAPGIREALTAMLRAGGGLAGSSAGAMVMGRSVLLRSPNPRPAARHAQAGLGLVAVTVVPHAEKFLDGWLPAAVRESPGADVLALDEQTGVVFGGGAWTVLGRGHARLLPGGSGAAAPVEPGNSLPMAAPLLV